METGISVERAIELIEANVRPVEAGHIRATRAQGRVLSEDVCAPMNQPPWPRSPLDGYAFRAADSAGASKESPVTLRVVETLYAGSWTDREVQPGEAVRLMTGAPIPAGCDCVIRQEDTDGGQETVRLFQALQPNDNYCAAGCDFKAGDLLLPAGTRLTGNALGVLANILLLGVHPTSDMPGGYLGKIIQKCTQTQTSKRYQSAEQLKKALLRAKKVVK